MRRSRPLPSQGEGRGEGRSSAIRIPPAAPKNGNGHGPRIDPDTAKPFDYGSGLEGLDSASRARAGEATPRSSIRRLPTSASPSSPTPSASKAANMQADAPACDVCGSITVRSGTCYKCLNCGNSMGCS